MKKKWQKSQGEKKVAKVSDKLNDNSRYNESRC